MTPHKVNAMYLLSRWMGSRRYIEEINHVDLFKRVVISDVLFDKDLCEVSLGLDACTIKDEHKTP